MKFKVGDKIKRKQSSCGRSWGYFAGDRKHDTFTVKHRQKDTGFIELEGLNEGFHDKHFELAEKTPRFKIGDKVKRKKGTIDNFWKDSVRLNPDGIFTVKQIKKMSGYDFIVLEETLWDLNPDKFELVEENNMENKYKKEEFEIKHLEGSGYFIMIKGATYREDKYMHKNQKIRPMCGVENFHKTAKEAGECLDKYFEEVEITREQIAQKFGCREDQLKIVD